MIGRRILYSCENLKQWLEAGGTRAAEAAPPVPDDPIMPKVKPKASGQPPKTPEHPPMKEPAVCPLYHVTAPENAGDQTENDRSNLRMN
jgi:hypothetical protein